MQKILTEINTLIPKISRERFDFFPVSNEMGFDKTFEILEEAISPLKTNEVRVGIVIGQSHLPSILASLMNHIDLLICNDINPLIHQHLKFVFTCMEKAKSPSEFEYYYKEKDELGEYKNPIIKHGDIQGFWNSLSNQKSIPNKHFLSSFSCFQACRNALKKIKICYAEVDFFNLEQCKALSSIIKTNNARVTIINCSNLQHYEGNEHLIRNVDLLLQNSIDPIILYSIGKTATSLGDLKSCISRGTANYYQMLEETYQSQKPQDALIPGDEIKVVAQTNNFIKWCHYFISQKYFQFITPVGFEGESIYLEVKFQKSNAINFIQVMNFIQPWYFRHYIDNNTSLKNQGIGMESGQFYNLMIKHADCHSPPSNQKNMTVSEQIDFILEETFKIKEDINSAYFASALWFIENLVVKFLDDKFCNLKSAHFLIKFYTSLVQHYQEKLNQKSIDHWAYQENLPIYHLVLFITDCICRVRKYGQKLDLDNVWEIKNKFDKVFLARNQVMLRDIRSDIENEKILPTIKIAQLVYRTVDIGAPLFLARNLAEIADVAVLQKVEMSKAINYYKDARDILKEQYHGKLDVFCDFTLFKHCEEKIKEQADKSINLGYQ